MSILIKGVNMPKENEILCIDIHPDGKVCVNLDLHCTPIGKAIGIPQHGRLIDADAMCDGLVLNNPIVIYAECMPTIIDAEEGE